MTNEKKKGGCGTFLWAIVFLILIGSCSGKDSDDEQSYDDYANYVSQVEVVENEEVADIEEPTTEEIVLSDKEILFMDIPWGTSYSEVNDMHGELDMFPISGDSFMTCSVDEIILGSYQGIDFEYNDINIIGNAINNEIEVAGYKTQEVKLYFAYNIVDGQLNKTEDESSLYGGQYVFATENLEETSNDMKNKITSLYGEPHKVITDTDIYENIYTYTYWYGQNGTILVMKILNAENDTTDLYDNEITLSYAWIEGDNLLQNASDWLKNDALEKEKNNYGNDNTNGL